MEPGEFFGSFMDDYFAECEGHVVQIRRSLLALEEEPTAPLAEEQLRTVSRGLHTLKGLSGMVGFADAERVAHVMEDWLRAAADGGRLAPGASLDLVFDGAALLEEVLAQRRAGGEPPPVDELVAALSADARRFQRPAGETGAPGAAPPVSAAEAYRLEQARREGARLLEFEFVPSPELVSRGVRVETVRERLAGLGEIIHASPRVLAGRGVAFHFVVALRGDAEPPAEWGEDALRWGPHAAPAEDAGDAAAAAPAAAGRGGGNIVRVELKRLDELMRLLGELVITRSRLDAVVSAAVLRRTPADTGVLEDLNEALERQLRDLREGILQVRLVPVGEVFERMRFVVRDLARETGKLVRVQIEGQTTQIDKLLVERMMEPMLHLVRNAVSHGVERAEERERLGKPAEARLRLCASTAGERVRVEVEDDGRGIDASAVAERARAAGLAVPGGTLGEEALLDLLCAPGLSTRREADRASGRGIGMDVVRSTIRELGGEITLSTRPGEGTRFTVELPLTLMIVDALLVRVDGQVMAVPQPALLEVVQATAAEVVPFENNEVLRYRDRVLPLVHLRRLFGGSPEDAAPDRFTVLVVGSPAQPIGVAVDRVAGLREIVVRPLVDPLVAVPGVAGAAELGDGSLCLILDAPALAAIAQRRRAGPAPAAVPAAPGGA